MMGLFKPHQLKDSFSDDTSMLCSDASGVFINAASLKYFKSQLASLELNRHYHFNTGGQWSMHELLQYLLGVTGPADIYISTWAISEDPVRALMLMKERGYIRSIKCIFDFKIKEQKSKAYLLAQQNFDFVKLDKCHAKVTVISNDRWGITIPGSANYTRNPRIERGIVCTDPQAAQFDITWMNAIMAGESFFKVRGV